MDEVTDFLLMKIKQLYPFFERPDPVDIQVWQQVVAGYSKKDILAALKAYRAGEVHNRWPVPGVFHQYLAEQERPIQMDQVWNFLRAARPKDPMIITQRAMYGVFGVKMHGYNPKKDVYAPAPGNGG